MNFIINLKLDSSWTKEDSEHMIKRRDEKKFESLNFKDEQMNSNIKRAIEDHC